MINAFAVETVVDGGAIIIEENLLGCGRKIENANLLGSSSVEQAQLRIDRCEQAPIVVAHQSGRKGCRECRTAKLAKDFFRCALQNSQFVIARRGAQSLAILRKAHDAMPPHAGDEVLPRASIPQAQRPVLAHRSDDPARRIKLKLSRIEQVL